MVCCYDTFSLFKLMLNFLAKLIFKREKYFRGLGLQSDVCEQISLKLDVTIDRTKLYICIPAKYLCDFIRNKFLRLGCNQTYMNGYL